MEKIIFQVLISRYAAWNWTLHWSSGHSQQQCETEFIASIRSALEQGQRSEDRVCIGQYKSNWRANILHPNAKMSDQCLNFFLELWFGTSQSSFPVEPSSLPRVDCWDCTFFEIYLIPCFTAYKNAFLHDTGWGNGSLQRCVDLQISNGGLGFSHLLGCNPCKPMDKSPFATPSNPYTTKDMAALAKKERSLRFRCASVQTYVNRMQQHIESFIGMGENQYEPLLLIIPILTKHHFFLYIYDMIENCIEYYDSKMDHMASFVTSSNTRGGNENESLSTPSYAYSFSEEKREFLVDTLKRTCTGFASTSVASHAGAVEDIEMYHAALYWFIVNYMNPQKPPRFVHGFTHSKQQQKNAVDCGFFAIATAVLRSLPSFGVRACQSLTQEHVPGFREFITHVLDTALSTSHASFSFPNNNNNNNTI